MTKKERTIAKLVVISIIISELMFSNTMIVLFGLLSLLTAAIISYRDGKTSGIRNKKTLLLIVILLIQQIFVSIIHGSIQNNIITIFLLFSQIISILVIVDKNRHKNMTNLIMEYLTKITVLLSVYLIIVYIFGQKNQTYNANLGIYTQNMDLFGIKLAQSSIGGDVLGTYNVGSLLKNPNTMSFFSTISIYSLSLNNTRKKTKTINLLILLAATLLSGSRLAIALVAALPLVVALIRLHETKKMKQIQGFIPIILLISIIILATSGIGSEIKNINYNGRLERWRVGIENISLFGRGLKTDIDVLNNANIINTSMHNSYISLAINFGIVTSLIYLSLTIFAIIKSKGINKPRKLIILLLLLVISLSESSFMFYCGFNALIFLFLFSIIDKQEGYINENQYKKQAA